MKGFIHIYEGDGKGKTTCAVGLSIRCAGSGKKVLFTQFLKDGTSNELKILKTIEQIDVFSAKKHFGFTFLMDEKEKKEAKEYYQHYFDEIIERTKMNTYDMIVLDELIAAYNLQFVDQKKVIDFLLKKKEDSEIILTGRDPAKEITDLCDYHSQIFKRKHPFDQGIGARDGIEQ